MNVRHVGLAEAREMFPLDESARFVVRVGEDARDAALARCQADPTYQRWVLACLQVRISIQADQTFPHPPDRRAQIARVMRESMQENHTP